MTEFVKQKERNDWGNVIERTYVQDDEIDNIYHRIDDLKVDINNKMEALKKMKANLEKEMEPVKKKYFDSIDSEVEDEELEEKYQELSDKIDALDDSIEHLDDLLTKL